MIQRQDERQDWQTPPDFLALVRAVFGGYIGLDPCTVASNPCAALNFYTPETDGLSKRWNGFGPVFMNPPYGREIASWAQRLRLEVESGGVEAIALLPARTDTGWWHREVTGATAVCFLKGRIRFVHPETGERQGAGKFPSAVPYWGPSVDRFRHVFGPLGWTLRARLPRPAAGRSEGPRRRAAQGARWPAEAVRAAAQLALAAAARGVGKLRPPDGGNDGGAHGQTRAAGHPHTVP